MRAAIYTRISSDQTGEGLGVSRQLEDCQALAESLNWEVVEHFSDNNISAYSGRVRPGFEAMLDGMKNGQYDALICWHPDRLHRNMKDLERLITLADEGGIELRTVRGGNFDLSTPAGRMIASVMGAIARQESEHTSERRKRANEQKAASGVWSASRRPFGYSPSGEPHEPEAAAVSTAAADVLAGTSLRQVAREWNQSGLRTTHGGIEWRATSVRRVLANPRYAALVVHRGRVVGAGNWKPLIDQDSHHALLALFNDPSRTSAVSFERKHQGSGVYRCGECGQRLILHVATGGVRSYRCPQHHVRRQLAALDKYVDALVIARLTAPDAQLVLDEPERDLPAMQIARDGLQARADELSSLFAEGAIDGSQLRRGTSELRDKIAVIDAELAAARMVSPLADLVLTGDQLSRRWAELSPDIRGKVIDALITVTVHKSPKGLRRFDPTYVDIGWNTASE